MSTLLLQWCPLLPALAFLGAAAHARPQTHEFDMMTAQTRNITVTEHKLQMDIVGAGRPLALVGGGLTGWRSWEPHAERLSVTRRVARLQPLNVQLGLEGRTLPDEYSVELESAALKAALDDAGWTQPIDLVGWSYGGLIALDFALDHPERIRTLTLIEPPAFWVLSRDEMESPEIRALQALEIGDDVGASDLVAFLHTVGLLPPGDSATELPQWPIWMEHRRSLRMLHVPLSHEDDPARLEAFHKPVLLLTGTGTAAFHRRIQEVLAVRLPDAELIELPGGHAPNVVSMDRFLAELERFQERADAKADFGAADTNIRHTRVERQDSAAPPDAALAGVHRAISNDGTPIGYRVMGSGPPILFVHGTAADHRSWANFAPFIEKRVSVHTMDRRGRGLSGDASQYHWTREAEDVAAVANAIGEPLFVFGHSYGGLVSLEAALMTDNLKALILYEPPIPTGESTVPAGVPERIRSLVDGAELEEAMELMLREVALIPDHELEAYRRTPLWEARIPVAATIPRELSVEETYSFDAGRFADLRVPTYLVLGSESPDTYREAIGRLRNALPQSEVIVLQGQQHLAHHTAPELLAKTILRIMDE